MEEALKDKRFAHIAKDPKFRRIPKSERKVKIDKRFQSMFKDKKFTVKYTVDKRGRPVNQTSTENLKKYYDISSSEEASDSDVEDKESKKQKSKKNTKKLEKNTKNLQKKEQQENDESNDEEQQQNNESDGDFVSSNGSLLLVKKSIDSDSDEESKDLQLQKNEKQLKVRRKNEKKLDENVKRKLKDLTIDYARGEGVLFSDSSSDDESSEYDEDNEDVIEHKWGELDKEAEATDEITHRLAACNMDWDRIRAVDLMVLFHSFLPSGGLIHSITIYPSEFGLERMKEEEVKGPTELVKSKNKEDNNNKETHSEEEQEEGSNYDMEKLRQYQLNRLKYYYAVIVFDSPSTANKVYSDCDGLEYESSSTKLDLRFIPEDMTFDHEPKEVCDKLPDLTKYTPRQFTTSALQQVKVDLTWDETDLERQEIARKLNSKKLKLDEIDKNDIQAYLASATSEDESEDEVKKQLSKNDDSEGNISGLEKYKSLLKSIEQAEEEKNNKDVELEFTWGLGEKEKTKKFVKEKMEQNENLTPFEKYLKKRKEKKKAKRDQKKNQSNDNDENESDSEDSVPSDIDMNDPYFKEELKDSLVDQRKEKKSKKRKFTTKNSDDSSEENEKAELELLLMDEDEDNKQHFSMKRIEEAESLTKSKKKRLSKKKKDLKEEAAKDDFEVNVKDSRFNALYSSHLFNIDPADPHYRKTKGTEALIKEKLKRRNENEINTDVIMKQANEKNVDKSPEVNVELNSLIKSIKRNSQNLSKRR